MTSPLPAQTPEQQQLQEWIARVRGMHRWKRLAGVVGCVIGATLMLLGKYRAESAPPWAITAGLAIAGASWLVFIYVIWDRWRWVKANPFKPAS